MRAGFVLHAASDAIDRTTGGDGSSDSGGEDVERVPETAEGGENSVQRRPDRLRATVYMVCWSSRSEVDGRKLWSLDCVNRFEVLVPIGYVLMMGRGSAGIA